MNDGICKGLCVAVAVAVIVGPPPVSAEPMTVQAVVTHAGAPVSGVYDLRFRLWDAPTGGSQLGTEVVVEDRVVEAGIVTEVIDPGAPPGGELCWLELAVREHDSTGAFTVIGGRKALNPTPLANRSVRASSAPQASNALSVGQPGDVFLDWANLTDVPADLLDGDDDTLGGLVCSDGEVAKQTAGVWGCADDEGQVFSRTWVVGPVGDPLANGAALLAALAAIPTPTAAHEAQLVKLEPGRYDLGTASLELRPWISLEGSGRSTTTIASSICDGGGETSAVVENADDSAIQHLTVENSCADPTMKAIGLLLHGHRARVVNVFVRCNGGPFGPSAIVGDGDELELIDVWARALGGAFSMGIRLEGSASLTRVNVEAQATSRANGGWFGVATTLAISDSFFRASGGSSAVVQTVTIGANARLQDSTIIAQGTASGVVGLDLDLDSCSSPPCQLLIRRVSIESSEDAIVSINSFATASSVTIQNSRIRGQANGLNALDVTPLSSRIEILRSSIHGGTSSIVLQYVPVEVYVTHSQLSGGPAAGYTSSVTCAGVWDENFVFSASGCP